MKGIGLLLFYILYSFSAFGQQPSWDWAKSVQSDYFDVSTGIMCDAAGNVYVTGEFEGPSIVLGTYTLTNHHTGYTDIYVVKYSRSGQVLWERRAGGNDEDHAASIAVDSMGNAYV